MEENNDRMIVGLTTNWGRMSQDDALGKFPADYITHLQTATQVCEASLRQAGVSMSRGAAYPDVDIQAFASDLALKVDDCQRFGMGRMVPVEIQIQSGGVSDNGWSVFYKWLPGSSGLKVIELPFPNPTPNAARLLPPGLYAIRGEKVEKGQKVQTAITTVSVGGKEKIVFTIAAP